MRGYFGLGVESITKERNVGNLVRTAHAFGASFFFSIAPVVNIKAMKATDTSDAFDHMPYYQYEDVQSMNLPKAVTLIGIEFTDESIPLPSFRHPVRAAYILGPEMGHLSPEITQACAHIIKIPMKFCINVGTAGAIVMYDRMISMGKFAERPVRAGGPTLDIPEHTGGLRRKVRTK